MDSDCGIANGIYMYLSPLHPITGSDNVVREVVEG